MVPVKQRSSRPPGHPASTEHNDGCTIQEALRSLVQLFVVDWVPQSILSDWRAGYALSSDVFLYAWGGLLGGTLSILLNYFKMGCRAPTVTSLDPPAPRLICPTRR